PTNYFEPPINARYCAEVLWRTGENPRQCRAKPSRGGTKCWRHDEGRRIDATATRQRKQVMVENQTAKLSKEIDVITKEGNLRERLGKISGVCSSVEEEAGATKRRATDFYEAVAGTKKFINVDALGEGKITDLSPFQIYDELEGVLGRDPHISSTKRGLVIEVRDEDTEKKLLSLKTMAGVPVRASPDRFLNTSKGVVSHKDLWKCKEEKFLKKCPGVTFAKHIKKRRGEEMIPTYDRGHYKNHQLEVFYFQDPTATLTSQSSRDIGMRSWATANYFEPPINPRFCGTPGKIQDNAGGMMKTDGPMRQPPGTKEYRLPLRIDETTSNADKTMNDRNN
ncbi:Gag-like protein, partial [Elysia marginata]